MTKKFFTKDRISHFDIFDRRAEEAIKQMRIRLREGHAFDFQVGLFPIPLGTRCSQLSHKGCHVAFHFGRSG
jgi:hypothetical protein